MRKSLFHVLGATAVLGAALLTTTAASAAPHARAAAGPPAATTVTFTVTSGNLTITAPGGASLGTGLPGNSVAGFLGQVKVTDDRALAAATWTVSASSTAFTTGTGVGASTIPATAADYDPNHVTTTGVITVPASPPTVSLSETPEPAVVATAGTGNNVATWDPTISVDLAAAAVGGAYTSTLTQSVA